MKVELKKKIAGRIEELCTAYKVVGVLDVSNIPAMQLQNMRAKLRGDLLIFMAKKRVIRIALENAKKSKKGVEALEGSLSGMPALVFANISPFRLASMLRESRTPAPAKPGQLAPRDIVIPAGPTAFAPGPVIGELGAIGIKTGVEGGKIAIKQDHVAAKKGEAINKKTAEVLAKLGIMPMEIGLSIKAAYEDGFVFTDALEFDDKKVRDMLAAAVQRSQTLALAISYPTKSTISLLIAKAHQQARGLARAGGIITKGNAAELIALAVLQARTIQDKFIKGA